MQAYKYAAVFVAGFVVSILLIGYISETRQEITVKDCELMGQFRHDSTVFACQPQPPQGDQQ